MNEQEKMLFVLIAAFWKNGVEKWETWRIFCQIFTLNVQKHQKFSEKHAYLADFPQKHTKKALEFGRGGPKKGYVILTFARNQANSYQSIAMLPNLVEV